MRVLKSQQNTPVNVKVAGERQMLKNVTLRPVENMRGVFSVHTGKRGRPRLVESSNIVKVTVLKTAPARKVVRVKRVAKVA